MKRFTEITFVAIGALLLATAPSALAGDKNCFSDYGGVINGPAWIDGNLTVPDNTSCLAGNSPAGTSIDVKGNVTVGKNASLTLVGNSTIFGNLHADNCAYVELNPAETYTVVVGGNTQISNCSGAGNPYYTDEAFASRGPNNRFVGNVQCQNNPGSCVLAFAFVGGNYQIKNNSSSVTSGAQAVDDTINGNLQCSGNSGTPPRAPIRRAIRSSATHNACN